MFSVKDLRSQLLVEEDMVENTYVTLVLFAMVAKNNGSNFKGSSFFFSRKF